MNRILALAFGSVVGGVLVGCSGAPDDLFTPGPADDAAADVPVEGMAGDGGDVDANAPLAFLSAAGLDFGLVDCGGSAPPNQTLTLRNLGKSPLTWNASLSASDVFALVEPLSGTVVAGGSATITVSAAAVAASATAGATSQGLLTITSNDALHAKSDLPLKLTPGGASIVVSPTAAFGQVPLNTPATALPIAVTNTGNEPVAVTFMQPANPQFGILWTESPSSVTLQPGTSVPGLVATFTPRVTTHDTTTASISTTGVLCGSVPTLKLTGQGTVGAVTVSPAEVFFGQISCNTTALSQKVRISNNGVGSFQFTAALTLGAASPYTLSTATGTVNANGFIDIGVVPKKVPQTSLTTDDLYADTLTITTLGIPNDPPHVVPLHETAYGARLAFSAPSIAFADVPVQTTKSTPFSVTNSGNSPATVTLASAAPFGVASSGTFVFPGSTGLAANASFSPLTVGAAVGSVVLTAPAGTVLCAPLPPAMSLGGRGTNGQVAVSTTSLDFSLVSCNTTAAPQSFTLTNSGTAAFTWSGALKTGTLSPYTFSFAPLSAGTLNPGDVATITVTPKKIPAVSEVTAGLYNDTLTISTSVPGDTGTPIQLLETARGAILNFVPGTLPFPNVPVTQTANAGFQVTNTGNLGATVTLSSNDAHFTVNPAGPVNVDSTTPLNSTATFTPGAASGAQSGIISATTGTAICGPLPTMTTNGTGTNGVLFVTPSAIDFSLTNCGAGAPPQVFRVRNDGNGAFDWTLALASGNGFYTLSQNSGLALAPGAFVDITVTSSTIPATSMVTPNLYGDTLNVGTSITGGNTHAVPITQTAQGVYLITSVSSIDFGNVSIISGSPATSPVTVTNNGNVSGTITAMTSNAVFGISPATMTLGPGGGFVAGSASFMPAVLGRHDGTLDFLVQDAVFCGNSEVTLTGFGTP